ncbi:MAG: LuxR C-terminal-related transcriptional regulator [Butyrivibrio sp.]|nr:LuxR C-terminal-related transcriptional regulator [Butyrivibrio sp.]
MDYIKVPKVYEKLKKAEEFFSPVIMTAGSGWGKTAAAEYYYRRKSPKILCCRDGNLTQMPSSDSFRTSVVIIEDLQWIFENESIRYLKEILRKPGIQVVMLTRGEVPRFLAAEEMDLDFVRIQERDFAFGIKEVEEFFEKKKVPITSEDAELVTRASQGYVRAVYSFAARMDGGKRFSKEIGSAVWQDMFHLWDGQLYDQWSDEFVRFALAVCRYEDFTAEMAEQLTGNKKISSVIEYCRSTTSQLNVLENGRYALREETRKFFCWKQELTWSETDICENYRKAAGYYEMHDDISNALRYYKKAGATNLVKELLIRNAYTHPGTGHYVETRDYYCELSEEELKDSPVLMAGMSMLYSLILLPEKSEKWYGELRDYYLDKKNGRDLRREAGARLAYLDIGLPHRGAKGILGIMKNVFSMLQSGEIVLPEFAATGNMPSIMNGGLDFSQWSKNDVQIARFMGKPVSTILGSFGKGLVTLCLAESGFEKGTMPAYEVLTRCCDGFDAASHGGTIEMCFVSVGIQIRQHLVEGQLPSAKRILDSFREKATLEEATQLTPNIEALTTLLSLFSGTGEQVDNYLKTVSDARVFFCITDRYRQMVKLRCLIAKGLLDEAFDLSSFLTGYFSSYNRPFLWIENEVLKAIILYRLGDEHWKEHLRDAMKRSSEYHFVRIFSLEGAVLLPLLKQMKEEDGFGDLKEEFVSCIYKECIKVASSYTDYMKYIPKENISFTNRESQVLSLLCAGMPMEEICETLGITYDGLKKHNRNIYKKLGVKGRAEAERKAAQLGIVHRG